MPLDQTRGQPLVEAAEGGAEALGLLVALAVLGQLRGEGGVGHEAAVRAKAQRDVAARVGAGRGAALQQDAAVGRHATLLVEDAHGAGEAVGADGGVGHGRPLLSLDGAGGGAFRRRGARGPG